MVPGMTQASTQSARRFAEPPLFAVARWRPGLLPASLARRLPPLPLPLAPLQPVLNHVVRSIAHRRPRLFERLGDAAACTFLIDVLNTPIMLCLRPDPRRPQLYAVPRGAQVPHDVRIAGRFADIFRLLDSEADSDALFFSRSIVVEGNTEAIVALRNAIDDLDGTLAQDIAEAFGPLAPAVRLALKEISRVIG